MVLPKAESYQTQFLVSNTLPMTQELSIPVPQYSDSKVKPNRDLAWRIAPTLMLSFKYAWAGVRYAFLTQRNFRIHTVIGILAITLGIFLQIPLVELAVIGLTTGLVMAMEMLNTAIESVVDLTVKQTYHELAKIAKDCAAGAVLISAITAIFVAGSLLLPPLIIRIESVLG
ncbi:MAG: diacylglycerol kinase family protein [Moorea sp. SIO3I7]|uniref:Diacylglycerol kinase n=2 Tax=Coleofasciculaceae TaxID=1892251 RepID=A0A1D8TP46_9CYAN|nr:diacylglycerol kinase family protein [Moorena producens]NEO00673.1 diacylglycerol kinase family protein [Moorena sp. SIO3I7]NEO16071.1 diacylglycerol kinase family protein [Moorena sp. SIO3E8]NEO63138.1 diacylglycerol kinase family protein [Moorena sp. SIO4G2]NEO81755.1 diacylglycerol kinase family protein [Moorena sp. SIO4G3]NEQ02592.1 diacylglycerol kinase family protein [Moorena sp. SIO3F7]